MEQFIENLSEAFSDMVTYLPQIVKDGIKELGWNLSAFWYTRNMPEKIVIIIVAILVFFHLCDDLNQNMRLGDIEEKIKNKE